MAYCGAEVIKVESSKRPDVTRLFVPPRNPELGIQPELSPWFTDWNAGKRFVSLDLTTPAGVELAKSLVAHCDIVIDNYATGVLDKLGLGFAVLEALKPDLIFFSTTGFGNSGPDSKYISWGPNIETLSGLAELSGFANRNCTMTQFAYPDPLSALHGLFAILCALEHHRNTGEGQRISQSQVEATAACIGDVLLDQLGNGREEPKLGNGSLHRAVQGCYPCAGEDRWCAISVEDGEEFARFCALMGHPETPGDPRFATQAARRTHATTLDALIGTWTDDRDAYELMHALQAAGISAGVVQSTEDQLNRDPHLAARGFFEEIPHKKKGKVIATGLPLGLTETPGRTSGTGSSVGEDNAYVFGELLGLSVEEIADCVECGAIDAP